MAEEISTPINTLSRDNLIVLLANNLLNDSVEIHADCDVMETDSPLRKPGLLPVSKKLFHSPMPDSPNENTFIGKQSERNKKVKKRKQTLIPDSYEKITKVYVKECDKDGYSPELRGGMRKKMLISLFHNKEYCMDFN